ncbi:hypothetical protein V1226_17395 [Lachnospiraceae bacterium JLR.KK009]
MQNTKCFAGVGIMEEGVKLYMRNWQYTFCFTNLDPSVMYYLEFGKQNDTQIYTFEGTKSNGK